jgi:hypothetical protein
MRETFGRTEKLLAVRIEAQAAHLLPRHLLYISDLCTDFGVPLPVHAAAMEDYERSVVNLEYIELQRTSYPIGRVQVGRLRRAGRTSTE